MLDTTPVAATIKHLISTGTTEQVLLGNKASLGSVEALLTARAHLHPGKVLRLSTEFRAAFTRSDPCRLAMRLYKSYGFQETGQIIDGDIVMVRRRTCEEQRT
jgi:hypothetical protein